MITAQAENCNSSAQMKCTTLRAVYKSQGNARSDLARTRRRSLLGEEELVTFLKVKRNWQRIDMNLILMRHGERKHNKPERKASLTEKGVEKAHAIAIELAEQALLFDHVVSSTQEPTKQTALLLAGNNTAKCVALELLDPPLNETDEEHYSPQWSAISQHIARSTSKALNDERTIAIVGHHPGITNLLGSVTGEKCRRIGRGEAILVTGSLQEIGSGKGNVVKTFGAEDAPEALRKKIELKMTVCTFLAGFTIPVLVELLKSEPQEMLRVWRIFSIIAFTFSLSLFVAAVFAFDLLLMPTEYWGAINPKSKPRFRRWSKFSRHYRLSGALYAYMVQTWRYFFAGGLLFIVVGFASLLLKGKLEELLGTCLPSPMWFLVAGASLAVILTWLLYLWLRPRLGIVD